MVCPRSRPLASPAMKILPRYRATIAAVLALAFAATPVVVSITDGTSNTLNAAASLSLNFAKITE